MPCFYKKLEYSIEYLTINSNKYYCNLKRMLLFPFPFLLIWFGNSSPEEQLQKNAVVVSDYILRESSCIAKYAISRGYDGAIEWKVEMETGLSVSVSLLSGVGASFAQGHTLAVAFDRRHDYSATNMSKCSSPSLSRLRACPFTDKLPQGITLTYESDTSITPFTLSEKTTLVRHGFKLESTLVDAAAARLV